MKKSTRFISACLCALLVLSMGTTAFASNTSESRFVQDSTIAEQWDLSSSSIATELSAAEYEAVLADVRKQAEEAITPELISRVKVLREAIDDSKEFQQLKNDPGSKASYDSVSLEALLCTNDGLSLLDIFAIGFTHANAARDEAIDLYEDQGSTVEMKRDAFRHMTWNFRSLKGVGEGKTRIATINHEWAYLILPAVTQYEQTRYNYYFDLYYTQIIWGLFSINDIMMMAKADADAYAVTYRNQLIQSCKNSLSVFNSTFSGNSYIMDFWNNKVGRDYAKSNANSSTNTVFTTAWNAGELIKHEGSTAVTSAKRSTLHSTNWWYIS